MAPNLVAIVPIFKKDEEKEKVRGFIDKVLAALVGDEEVAAAKSRLASGDVSRYFFDRVNEQCVVVDWRDNRPGDKQFHWEQRGVPFRIEVGPRDVEAGAFVLKKRLDRSKETVALGDVSPQWLRAKLEAVQAEMYQRALTFRDENTRRAGSYDELKQVLSEHGGFVRCYFKPDREAEAKIKEETKATVRCLPEDQPVGTGKCIFSGEETATEAVFALAY